MALGSESNKTKTICLNTDQVRDVPKYPATRY